MHRLIAFSLLSLLFGLAATEIAAPAPAESKSATVAATDVAWQRLEDIRKAVRSLNLNSGGGRVAFWKQSEELNRQYRESGLAFYEQYSDDPRRWEWLVNTLQSAPAYWTDIAQGAELRASGNIKDAVIDKVMEGHWQALMEGRLVPQFLASHQATSQQRSTYFRLQLNKLWDRSMDRHGNKEKLPVTDVQDFVRALALHAAEPATGDGGAISWGISHVHLLMWWSGIDLAGRWQVVNTFAASPNEKLRKYAGGMERVLQLHETRLELKLTSLENKPLNVADWRGKVVLVDFWSTSCSSCVAAMPHLKKVYEGYRDKGFEMVLVCMDAKKNRGKVEGILTKVGAPWLNTFEEWKTSPLPERFGFTFVPVYFLLDQSGKLVTTDLYEEERLEIELKRLLANKVAGN